MLDSLQGLYYYKSFIPGRTKTVIPAVNTLNGCDVTSKIGTKKVALKAPAVQQLAEFTTSDHLSDEAIQKAEFYLIKVLSLKSQAKSFTEYRKELYHHSKSAPSMLDLPSNVCRA